MNLAKLKVQSLKFKAALRRAIPTFDLRLLTLLAALSRPILTFDFRPSTCLFAVLALTFAALPLRAQISGAGQLGCNAVPVTGTAWSSATAVNTTQTLASNVAGATVVVVLDQTSTITAGAISFQEDYGDGNLVTVNSWQVVDPTSSSFAGISLPYTLAASTNKAFEIQMGGAYKLVLKLTTVITGTATITPYTNLVCYSSPEQVNVANTPNVNVQSNASTNLAQVAGTALGAPSNYGTSPGAVAVPGVNAFVTNTPAVTQSSGPWTFNMTQVDGTALGAPSNYGTSPGAVAVSGVNAFVTNAPSVTTAPQTSSTYAATSFHNSAVTTASTVKSSAGNLYGYFVYNPNSSVCYLEFFNTTSVTLGTTSPVFSLGIPATSGANIAPTSIALGNFSTAMAVAATSSDGGSSACSTGMSVNLWYQ